MQIRNSTGIYNFSYIYDGSVLVARVNSDGTKQYYHPDHLGSTTLVTDSSGKATNFTYDSKNARLARINTSTAQEILFNYDPVGNIVMINDTANARQQIMAYDYLDRLLNMSLNNGQSFVYQYDAIGNLLKIMRESASVTRLSYGGRPVHAPSMIVTGNANVDIVGVTLLNNSNRSKVVEFRILNDRNGSAATVNFTVGFGDNSFSNSTINFNAGTNNESVFVFAGHDYAAGGSYEVNVTAGSLGSPSDYEGKNAKFGIVTDAIEITSRNITNVSYRFNIKNDLINSVSGISWQCNNGLSASGITVNGSYNKTVEEVYNYSSAGSQELNCSVSSTEGSGSIKTSFEIKGIEIEAYNRTFADGNTTIVRFNVTNYFYPRAVDWRIVTDGQTFTGTTPTIATGFSVPVSQEINYTVAGQKNVDVNITADKNLSDTFSDKFTLKAVEIEDYYFRNVTLARRSFDFMVKNLWTSNISSNWNLTDPAIANSSFYLDSGESMWVYIEADYATTGVKRPVINAYSGSLVKAVIERFVNSLIGISNYMTIVEDRSSSVTETFIKSNKDAYNVSWVFRAGNATFTSNNITLVNSSEGVVLIIESNYPTSDVYNATLFVNSSSLNESAGGVIIT